MQTKYFVTLALFLIAAILCYGVPKERYQGSGALAQIHLPISAGEWIGKRVPPNTINLENKSTYYINSVLIRQYIQPHQPNIYFSIFDAANFHNPKICFISSGYEDIELPDTVLPLNKKQLLVSTTVFKKDTGAILVLYWMIIDQHQVSWSKQKLQDLWFAILNKPRIGFLVRMDIPLQDADLKHSIEAAKDLAGELSKSFAEEESNYVFGI